MVQKGHTEAKGAKTRLKPTEVKLQFLARPEWLLILSKIIFSLPLQMSDAC